MNQGKYNSNVATAASFFVQSGCDVEDFRSRGGRTFGNRGGKPLNNVEWEGGERGSDSVGTRAGRPWDSVGTGGRETARLGGDAGRETAGLGGAGGREAVGLGVGNGNPFQHSCLENPMERGKGQATVLGGHKELVMT